MLCSQLLQQTANMAPVAGQTGESDSDGSGAFDVEVNGWQLAIWEVRLASSSVDFMTCLI